MTDGSLTGKVALITGAASGIGRAAALLFAATGASVAMVDKNLLGMIETGTAIKAAGGRCDEFLFDLRQLSAIPKLVHFILDRLNRVDILLNIAGVTEGADFLDVDDVLWNEILAVNTRAPFILMQEVGRHMIARGGGGKIVNVSSSSSFRASPVAAAYSTSKAALNQLTRVASQKLASFNINVNAVVPGFTDTSMMAGAPREWIKEGPLANPFQRISTPADVARVMLFLSLPDSRQMTGQLVHTSAGAVV
jgi:NAD(P)-dependent dehydrogenase (short-subunit alcohol dehydrogenase family)